MTSDDRSMESALAGLGVAAPASLASNVLADVGLADRYARFDSPIGPLVVAWNAPFPVADETLTLKIAGKPRVVRLLGGEALDVDAAIISDVADRLLCALRRRRPVARAEKDVRAGDISFAAIGRTTLLTRASMKLRRKIFFEPFSA